MRFSYDGREYRLAFRHANEEQQQPSRRTRRVTTARLLRDLDEPQSAGQRVKGSEEVMRASVRCYFKDKMTREMGRQYALRSLCHFLGEPLAGKATAAYYSRSRKRSYNADEVIRMIDKLSPKQREALMTALREKTQ